MCEYIVCVFVFCGFSKFLDLRCTGIFFGFCLVFGFFSYFFVYIGDGGGRVAVCSSSGYDVGFG